MVSGTGDTSGVKKACGGSDVRLLVQERPIADAELHEPQALGRLCEVDRYFGRLMHPRQRQLDPLADHAHPEVAIWLTQ